MPARLDRIGWNDDAFRAAALHGEGDVKFHEGYAAAEASLSLDPYDATCRSFWVRVDGVGFTKWSSKYCVAKPYERRPRRVRERGRGRPPLSTQGPGVVAAYTQSDEVTFLCQGPAVLAGGASDPSGGSSRSSRASSQARAGAARDEARGRRRGLLRGARRCRGDAVRRHPGADLAPPRRDANAPSQALRHLHGVRVQQELPPVDEALLADLMAGGVPRCARGRP